FSSGRSSGMNRMGIPTAAALTIVGAINYAMLSARHSTPPSSSSSSSSPVAEAVAAAPGLVDAVAEDIRVASQIGGRLAEVLVEGGDAVSRGQVLAVIENADYRARVASAEATRRLREADARRIHNGARDQERRDAAAAVREASAVVDNTSADVARKRELFKE